MSEVHERCELPEDAVVVFELEVVGYLTGDSKSDYAVRVGGEVPASTLLGHLDLVKDDILGWRK